MVFREVTVVQIKEALRRWLKGEGERPIAHGVGVDRKTARRYIAAALELGIDRSGGEGQLTDELIGQVAERVRPHRPDGHGEAWRSASRRRRAHQGLGERGPHRGQDRDPARPPRCRRPAPDPGPFCRRALRGGQARDQRSASTTRPRASKLQVDFGRLGLVPDGERRRVCHGLIFTAVFSRHQFVWPTFTQTHRRRHLLASRPPGGSSAGCSRS